MKITVYGFGIAFICRGCTSIDFVQLFKQVSTGNGRFWHSICAVAVAQSDEKLQIKSFILTFIKLSCACKISTRFELLHPKITKLSIVLILAVMGG